MEAPQPAYHVRFRFLLLPPYGGHLGNTPGSLLLDGTSPLIQKGFVGISHRSKNHLVSIIQSLQLFQPHIISLYNSKTFGDFFEPVIYILVIGIPDVRFICLLDFLVSVGQLCQDGSRRCPLDPGSFPCENILQLRFHSGQILFQTLLPVHPFGHAVLRHRGRGIVQLRQEIHCPVQQFAFFFRKRHTNTVSDHIIRAVEISEKHLRRSKRAGYKVTHSLLHISFLCAFCEQLIQIPNNTANPLAHLRPVPAVHCLFPRLLVIASGILQFLPVVGAELLDILLPLLLQFRHSLPLLFLQVFHFSTVFCPQLVNPRVLVGNLTL